MTRSRTDSTSPNREPVPPPAKQPETNYETEDDDRIVFSSWDAPLVPSKA